MAFGIGRTMKKMIGKDGLKALGFATAPFLAISGLSGFADGLAGGDNMSLDALSATDPNQTILATGNNASYSTDAANAKKRRRAGNFATAGGALGDSATTVNRNLLG